jgi:N-formylglutamate amidohydrolase
MIEVNRSLYMDEETGKKKETFEEVKEVVQGFLKRAESGFRQDV